MAIPGLHHIPLDDSMPSLELMSFNLKTYKVPGAHRYGKCRRLAEFEKVSVIGEGSYGIVYKVRDTAMNKIVALKKLKISKEMELMPQNFLREITNLKHLKHVNIINLIDVAVGKNFESTCLILEFCKYSLSKVIDDDPTVLKHPQIKNIMEQLFSGLDYIHKHSVVHRDLNPPNILFNETGILKISDFGSSRKIITGNATPNLGMLWYRAPEILFGSASYTSFVDMWSAGAIFAEMLYQKVLFRGDSDFEVITFITDFLGSPKESEWPEYTKLPLLQDYQLHFQPYNKVRSIFNRESFATVSLIHGLLSYNPSNRLSAEQCLKHPYFTELPRACSLEDLLCILEASETI